MQDIYSVNVPDGASTLPVFGRCSKQGLVVRVANRGLQVCLIQVNLITEHSRGYGGTL